MKSSNAPFGVMTELGLSKMDTLNSQGKTLVLTTFVIGDGNGAEVTPVATATRLTNQFATYPVSGSIEGVLSASITITQDMTQEHEGKWIREGGLLDEDGDLCVWVSYYPMPITQYISRNLKIALPAVNHDKLVIVSEKSEQEIVTSALSAISGGMVVNRKDINGKHQIMVRIPAFTNYTCNSILGTNWQPLTAVHPAFIRSDGTTMPWFEVGMYLCGESERGHYGGSSAYQKPMTQTLEVARRLTATHGDKWHVLNNAQWSAIAIWCLMRDSSNQPKGNTYYGVAHDERYQSGVRVDGKLPSDSSGTAVTFTGSGPNEWRHNGAINGIADLVGNFNEWVDGIKVRNNAIIAASRSNTHESEWETLAYINAPSHNKGSLSNQAPTNDNQCNFSARPWRDLKKEANYQPVQLLQQLLIEPTTGTQLANGSFYCYSEEMGGSFGVRGGGFSYGDLSGLACLYLSTRENAHKFAFRLAYYE